MFVTFTTLSVVYYCVQDCSHFEIQLDSTWVPRHFNPSVKREGVTIPYDK